MNENNERTSRDLKTIMINLTYGGLGGLLIASVAALIAILQTYLTDESIQDRIDQNYLKFAISIVLGTSFGYAITKLLRFKHLQFMGSYPDRQTVGGLVCILISCTCIMVVLDLIRNINFS